MLLAAVLVAVCAVTVGSGVAMVQPEDEMGALRIRAMNIYVPLPHGWVQHVLIASHCIAMDHSEPRPNHT